MNAAVRHQSGVAIVDLNGRLTIGESATFAHQTLIGLFDQGNKHILVNLANVNYVDSGGIGDLLAVYSSVMRRGGILKLLQPNERVRGLLRITRLDSVFEICENEQAAVTGFRLSAALRQQKSLDEFLE
jgi:anti-sigma B factor antagonist